MTTDLQALCHSPEAQAICASPAGKRVSGIGQANVQSASPRGQYQFASDLQCWSCRLRDNV